MVPDYHIHTHLCKHAHGTPKDYLAQALARELEAICFTDHIPVPDGYDPTNRMTLEQYPTYQTQVQEAAAGSTVTVLFGIEADYYPGCQNYLDHWLAAQSFDLVLGSLHYIRDWAFDNPETQHLWESVDIPRAWQDYFGLVGELADTGLFDVISHLDLPKKFGHRPDGVDLDAIAGPALDRVAAAGMGMEINTCGLRYPAAEIYPSEVLLRMAFERDIPITFGSDAHRPEHVAHAFDDAVALARRVGYTHSLRFRQRETTLVPLP